MTIRGGQPLEVWETDSESCICYLLYRTSCKKVGLNACHVDRRRGHWLEGGPEVGKRSPGHWLVSTPTATVPQTLHLTHQSEGVKLFIKAHEQVCPSHRSF